MLKQAIESEAPDLDYEADLCGNIEQALKALQGYGIMALELIQNADDAGARTLILDACDDALVVKNDQTFSRCSLRGSTCDWASGSGDPSGTRRTCNFHAITKMGGRSKLGSHDQIGRFGIGFVSVYQITDTPTVRSEGVEYTLNPRDRRARRRDVEMSDGTQFFLPWAFKASAVREAIHASVVPSDVADRVLDEVRSILPSSLLFLRNLERVELLRSGQLVASVDVHRTDTGLQLVTGPQQAVKRWIVQSRSADDLIVSNRLMERFPGLADLNRATTVSIAVPLDDDVIDGLLYAYLPTKHATGLPLHVNADFFPHASRQEIVLESESQERFWNEAMLAAAAAIVGERFELLKETLGHRRLWKLGEVSRVLASKGGVFGGFWAAFSSAAKNTVSVWTQDATWELPADVRSAPAQMGSAEQAALSSFGLKMLHPSLREFYNALHDAKVGVRQLRMADVTDALSVAPPESISDSNPNIRPLWSAVNQMLEAAGVPPRFQLATKPLKELTFLLDNRARPLSPQAARRLPDNVPADLLAEVLPDFPVVHPDVLAFPTLAGLIAQLDLDEFAGQIAEALPDKEAAERLFGPGEEVLQATYRLFVLLWDEQRKTAAKSRLANSPILKNSDGSFTVPSRAQLPGRFRDPTGWFHLVDTDPFPPGMERFAEQVLGLKVLSFSDYIDEHFSHALKRGIDLPQYTALLSLIADHRHELGDILDTLKKIPFVRNRAGELVLPSECYFWDAALEAILGKDPARWVDSAALPKDQTQTAILRDLFESKLGMPTRVAAHHVVERIQEISDHSSPPDAQKKLSPIFRHLIDRWTTLDEDYRNELAELQDIAFLPAQLDGEPISDRLCLPSEVYRAGRAPGFSSQVPVVDVLPLRQSSKAVGEILDLIGIEQEPETGVVVDHLIACIDANRPPHDLTYQILGERCDKDDGVNEIDRLADRPFIYDAHHGFLPPSRVFWSDPPFGRHWYKASRMMNARQELFSHLGVCVAPEPSHYAELALEIGALADRLAIDETIHSRCLRFLAEAVRDEVPGARDAVESLASEESLLTIAGNPIWPADALWMDSEQHLLPFGEDLNEFVVMPPADSDTAAVRKLYSLLEVEPLSSRVTLQLAEPPKAAIDETATERMRERAPLLVRLAPTSESRYVLRGLLDRVTVKLAPSLLTRAELSDREVPYRSEASPADVFIDRSEPAIYATGERVTARLWAHIARHLFDELAPLCPSHDMRSLAGTACNALMPATLEEAEEIIASFGFSEMVDDCSDVSFGEELSGDVEAIFVEPVGDDGNDACPQEDVFAESGRSDERDPADNESLDDGPANDENVVRGDPNDPYKSKTSGGKLAEDPQIANNEHETGAPEPRAVNDTKNVKDGADRNSRKERAERRRRRSRLRSYVESDDYESTERDEQVEVDHDDPSDEVGSSAVEAVLAFELMNGRTPEEQDHFNPGFDVISREAGGARRLIEIKGINGDWNEVGVKLTRRQFRFAQDHADEFWLYVVENARDRKLQRVRPMRNPFARVDEFFFDSEWRKACEAGATATDLLMKVGAKVHDDRWGTGNIVKIENRGITRYATVKFSIFGLKWIPVSKLNIVD